MVCWSTKWTSVTVRLTTSVGVEKRAPDQAHDGGEAPRHPARLEADRERKRRERLPELVEERDDGRSKRTLDRGDVHAVDVAGDREIALHDQHDLREVFVAAREHQQRKQQARDRASGRHPVSLERHVIRGRVARVRLRARAGRDDRHDDCRHEEASGDRPEQPVFVEGAARLPLWRRRRHERRRRADVERRLRDDRRLNRRRRRGRRGRGGGRAAAGATRGRRGRAAGAGAIGLTLGAASAGAAARAGSTSGAGATAPQATRAAARTIDADVTATTLPQLAQPSPLPNLRR